jgi:excinuclease ABC subunit A
VEGIAPAVAIEQKNPTKTSRSTVGTATEVHDYLRLLWARGGRTYCPECGEEVRPDTVQSATDAVLALEPGTRVVVAFPLPLSARASRAGRGEPPGDGVRPGHGRLDDTSCWTSRPPIPPPWATTWPVRRRRPGGRGPAHRGPGRERLADSIGTAFAEGEGEAVVVVHGESAPDQVTPRPPLRFSERFRCEEHPDIRSSSPTPRLFSFNNPYGSCTRCTGFGAVLEYDESLIVPVPERSIRDRAPWIRGRSKRYRKKYRTGSSSSRSSGAWTGQRRGSDLPERFRRHVIHGAGGRGRGRASRASSRSSESRERKRYKAYIRVFLRKYQLATTCPECGGARLRPEALHVRVAGLHIGQVAAMTISEPAAGSTALGEPLDDDAGAGSRARAWPRPSSGRSRPASPSSTTSASATSPSTARPAP